MRLLVVSLKRLLILKIVPEAASQFLYQLPSLSMVDFFSSVHTSLDAGKICAITHVLGGFKYDFSDNR